MTKETLKQKFKKQHSRIKYAFCSISPITTKHGNVAYLAIIKGKMYLYKNKKDAFKVFINAVEKYLDN